MQSILTIITSFFLFNIYAISQTETSHNLVNDRLANRWDEAIPLGNGMLGALVWQKSNKLRVSLDRADLWDERTAMDITKFNYQFVQQQLAKNEYDTIHVLGDEPYDNIAYPTKLPGGALEFDMSLLGAVKNVSLDISSALCVVEFNKGTRFNSYIHATDNVGYFGVENFPFQRFEPELIIPDYNVVNDKIGDNSHSGGGLQKLGYIKGTVLKTANSIRYHQPTYEGHFYEILIRWNWFSETNIIGEWTIANDKVAVLSELNFAEKEPTGWPSHLKWWKDFWQKSFVTIPDTQLEKQYYLEMYKLGCVARKNAPAITLQAIWTADNGSLPPWKGDFHHDLNTQLSYWPAYTSNHLQEAATFTDWLWKVKEENKKFTKQFFGVKGLAVPGVSTINGKPMGGWIQYSLSPTVSSWLAQHFYWQWKYSMDENFLQTRLYPYIHGVAVFIENVTYIKNGKRLLPLSTSPEFNDNDVSAWFYNYTNFDLALFKFALGKAVEVADKLHKTVEANHWENILSQLPDFDINETGFTIAPGTNLAYSHRHFSPYMSIYPLCLLNMNDAAQKIIIQNSLHHIQQLGTREWCGYSFAWMASLYARALEADSAVRQLQIFATNFCSNNSFHLNGDQKGGEYSDYTYRPFTLEGNFAFAQGIHELLLQSKEAFIEVFPAVPQSWKNVSFSNLRAEGAFLISAEKQNGLATSVKVFSEKGGILHIKLPFKTWGTEKEKSFLVKVDDAGIVTVKMQKGQTIIFKNGYE